MALRQVHLPETARHRRLDTARIGFTLIEILVVVAIMGLLMAILLPAIEHARDQARFGVCGSNMAQLLKGARMQLDAGRLKNRVTTNLGWALPTFRNNSQETGVFTCPGDANPYAIPALYDRYYGDFNGRYHDVTTASDGVFNRVGYSSSNREWQLKVEDLVQGAEFGFDVDGASEYDLLLKYKVNKGDRTATVTVGGVAAALKHSVLDHKGRTVWPVAQNAVGQSHKFPILWMSYGANAAAGLSGAKGNMVLLVECAKPGVFPERLSNASASDSMNSYPNDHLAAYGNQGTPLRFRHGGTATDARLRPADYGDAGALRPTQQDRRFSSRDHMNAGFIDGHVERRFFEDLIGDAPSVDNSGKLRWRRPLWLGSSPALIAPSY